MICFTKKESLQSQICRHIWDRTVYPKKYAHGFVVLCFVVVMQSFIMNSHEVFIYIHQGCFAGTEAIVRLPQCQWSKPDGYGKISQCITTTKHSKAETMCIFLGIYCSLPQRQWSNYTAYGRYNYNKTKHNNTMWVFCVMYSKPDQSAVNLRVNGFIRGAFC